MGPIKILPHHAIRLFEVFYLDWKSKDVLSWYGNENMKQNGVKAINSNVSNPDQLVQIVDSYDEICRMCPRNKQGNNYDGNPETTCNTYDSSNNDVEFAKILGLEKIPVDKPITSKRFFELMKPTYEKLMMESHYNDNGKRKPLRQMFRVKNEDLLNLMLYLI